DTGEVGVAARLEHPSIAQEHGPCSVSGCAHACGDRPGADRRIIQLALGQKTGVNTVVVVAPSYQHLPVLEHCGCMSLPALEHAAGCCPGASGRIVKLCGSDRNTVEVNGCAADGQHLTV